MFERKIVVFVVVKGEREFYLFIYLLRCMNFLSRKIHLELLWCFLDQENDYSNFKKKIWKSFAYRESVGASFLGLLSKI